MNFATAFKTGLSIIVLSSHIFSASPDVIHRKFDEFADLNCEDEMSRLDNFALQLRAEPDKYGLIIFYGGRRMRGKIQRRGDSAARAVRLKSYLIDRRGLRADKIVVIDAGYSEEWHAELWIALPGFAWPPALHATVPTKEIRFRKGTARPRDFRCEV